MHGHAMPGERIRRAMIRDPSAVPKPRPLDRADGGRGVSHAVDVSREPEPAHRPEQEVAQLPRALPVAPVADPHEVALLAPPQRTEDARVRGFVPGPDAVVPTAVTVDLCDRLAESEHAGVAAQVVAAHLAGCCH